VEITPFTDARLTLDANSGLKPFVCGSTSFGGCEIGPSTMAMGKPPD
jgi:hypothetical protein